MNFISAAVHSSEGDYRIDVCGYFVIFSNTKRGWEGIENMIGVEGEIPLATRPICINRRKMNLKENANNEVGAK